MNATFLLGIMGLLQAIFLPGFIILRLSNIACTFLRSLIISFALSLIFNYVLILGLAWFHFYTPMFMRTLFCLELLLACYLARKELVRPSFTGQLFHNFKALYYEQCAASAYLKFSFCLALFIFAYVFILYLNTLGNIFHSSDAIVMWNKWATEWSMNAGFSTETWHYAQLMPINYSVPYVMIGNIGEEKLQYFATAIAHLFPLMAMMVILDFIIARKQAIYLLAIPLLMLFYARDLNGLFNGCADIPVSVMGLIALYILLLAKDEKQSIYYLILGAVLCAGAAVTKQPGLYLASFYPALGYMLVLRNRQISFQQKFLIVILQYALIGAIVLPWYLYTQWLINHGLESSELSFITSGIYGNVGPLYRIWPAWVHQVGVVWLGVGLSVVGIFNHKLCRTLCLIAFPYFMLWSMFACYDNRNLALILPWLALAGSAGCYYLSEKFSLPNSFKVGISRLKKISWLSVILFLVFICLILTFIMPTQRLLTKELTLEQQLGGGEISSTLYSYQRLAGFQGKICTDWQFLGYLPGLNQYYYFEPLTPASIDEAINNPQVSYFLTFKANQEVSNHFTKLTMAKTVEIVAISADGNTVIYKILRTKSLGKST